MAVRLISTTSLRLHIVRWSSISLVVVDARLLGISGVVVVNALVCSSWNKFLGIVVSAAVGLLAVVIRSTAADGEHPEETASDGKHDCEPGGGEE